MATIDFDDYDTILSSLHGEREIHKDDDFSLPYRPASLFVEQQQNPQNQQPQQPPVPSNFHSQQFQVFQSTTPNGSSDHTTPNTHFAPSRYNSVSSTSAASSELNFNDLTDGLSSLSSSILSPYSSGSSPDDFLLPGGQSVASNPYFVSPQPPQQPPQPAVPMGESMSTSTVTYNNTNSVFDRTVPQPASRTSSEGTDPKKVKAATSRGRKKTATSVKPKSEGTQPGKTGRKVKSSHNLIEKKYRTNINSKIVELRNCVPALRILVSKSRLQQGSAADELTNDGEEQFDDDYVGNGYSDDERKLDGLKPARKLNKATILSKATEYIRHLEAKNARLVVENQKLKELLIASGNVPLDGQMGNNMGQMAPQVPMGMAPGPVAHPLYSDSSYNSSPSFHSNSSNVSPTNNGGYTSPNGVQGQVPQPPQMPPQHMQAPQQPLSMTNKMVMGGMTCMLGVSAMDDFAYNSGTGHKGLFALPVMAFDSISGASFNTALLRPVVGLMKLVVCAYMVATLMPILWSKSSKSSHFSFTPLLSLLLNPSHLLDTSTENAEFQLVQSVQSEHTLAAGHVFRALLLPASGYNCFVKAVYMKRVGLDWLGRHFWNKSDLALTRDFAYSSVSLAPLAKYKDYKSPLSVLVARSVVEQTVQTALQNMVRGSVTESAELRNETVELLRRAHNVAANLPAELAVRVQVLEFLLTPSAAALNEAFSTVKESASAISADLRLGLICCALKWQFRSAEPDCATLLVWLSKLRLPSFTSGFAHGSQLTLFGFATLLSLLDSLSFETLDRLDAYVNTKKSTLPPNHTHQSSASVSDSSSDVFSTVSAASSSSSFGPADELLLARHPAIPKINFRLLNAVANMRIYAGNACHAATLGLDAPQRRTVVRRLVAYIEKLNGF